MAQDRRPNPDFPSAAGSILRTVGSILRVFLWTLILAGGIALSFKGREIDQLLRIAAGYKAKILCSAVFVSGRSAESVLAEDVAVDDLWPLRLFPAQWDGERQVVRVSFLGSAEAVARHHAGRGCVVGETGERPAGAESAEASDELSLSPPAMGETSQAWAGATDAASPPLRAALDWGFAEPDPAHPRRTRALLVMQDGKVVAERYAPGFGPDTPLAGWSMAKTALNALVGILVGEGSLKLDAPVDLPEWQGDARSSITLDQLLRMSSGLEFSEEYGELLQDVTKMLLLQPSAAAFAAGKPLLHPPGSHWYYASGTSNIISGLIRSNLGEARYRRFPRDALFGPLGMDSAVIERDAAGNFVASSFMYATARDWAKLGQLFLQDGVWRGKRLLPEGWVRYSTTPAPADSSGQYGAHLWLQIPDSLLGPDRVPLPPDSFHAIGFESQFVTVVPSRRAVLVRLGLTRYPGSWRQDRWAEQVLAALPR